MRRIQVSFRVGDLVKNSVHPKYGLGIVIEIRSRVQVICVFWLASEQLSWFFKEDLTIA
jgi:hypothetical protein